MVYCSSCGTQIADDAYFCPKCGVKTQKGREADVLYPTDRLTDAFYAVGLELEKAFNQAARETHAAIQRAKENLSPRPTEQPTVVCPKCNSKNPSGAIFCNNCGNRIAAEQQRGSVV